MATTTTRQGRLIREPEVREWLGGMTRPTLRALIDGGELPCVRVGGRLRFDPSDVEAYIERMKGTGPTARPGRRVR